MAPARHSKTTRPTLIRPATIGSRSGSSCTSTTPPAGCRYLGFRPVVDAEAFCNLVGQRLERHDAGLLDLRLERAGQAEVPLAAGRNARSVPIRLEHAMRSSARAMPSRSSGEAARSTCRPVSGMSLNGMVPVRALSVTVASIDPQSSASPCYRHGLAATPGARQVPGRPAAARAPEPPPLCTRRSRRASKSSAPPKVAKPRLRPRAASRPSPGCGRAQRRRSHIDHAATATARLTWRGTARSPTVISRRRVVEVDHECLGQRLAERAAQLALAGKTAQDQEQDAGRSSRTGLPACRARPKARTSPRLRACVTIEP